VCNPSSHFYHIKVVMEMDRTISTHCDYFLAGVFTKGMAREYGISHGASMYHHATTTCLKSLPTFPRSFAFHPHRRTTSILWKADSAPYTEYGRDKLTTVHDDWSHATSHTPKPLFSLSEKKMIMRHSFLTSTSASSSNACGPKCQPRCARHAGTKRTRRA
jgi:hypothetical protein